MIINTLKNNFVHLAPGTWVARRPLGRPRTSSVRRGQKSTPELICELGQVFYNLGWVSGTGGGISIRYR